MSYPDASRISPFTIHYEYRRGGFLSGIRDVTLGDAGPMLLSEVEYDALGRVASERLGNQVTTLTQYNPNTTRLGEIQTINPGGEGLQDSHYELDGNGNLFRRSDQASRNAQRIMGIAPGTPPGWR